MTNLTAKSGKFESGSGSKQISQELKEKMNGMLLADALTNRLITIAKGTTNPFTFKNVKGTRKDGTTYENKSLVLMTEQGEIIISDSLAQGDIKKYLDNLGDLRFRIHTSEDGEREFFRLGQPGSNAVTSYEAATFTEAIEAA